MRKTQLLLVLSLIIISFHFANAQSPGTYSGFLKQNGKKIVDENGKDVLLRSMGLGGWMLQEGYMLQTSGFANTQHQIRAKITDLIGADGANEFYEAWLTNHCTHKDIDSLAKWGFNAVRLPFHYHLFTPSIEEEPVAGQNTWLPRGFQLVDSLLKWCKNNKMYLILDMHAAPGGQGNDLAISDRDDTKPSLWDSPANRAKAIALWKKLAEKYVNEPWIGGYDLLNETNWTMTNNGPLKQYYLDLTAAIRSVDTNHILFIEGNWFANDFTNLTPPWDNNMAYSFHKYWNENTVGTVQWMIDIRNNNNVPIWLGESGENSNQWFADCISMLEGNNIGWSWWPVKKIGSVVDPVTIPMTTGYQNLLDYWNGKASKPSFTDAKNALMDLTEKLKIENCPVNYDVIDAMFRQTTTNDTKPYRDLKIPGLIYAMDFDMGKNGYAYKDNVFQNANNKDTWNNGWIGRNDGVDLEADVDSTKYSKGIHVGWIETGEWLKYTVKVDKAGFYDISFRVAHGGSGDGLFHLEKDGQIISKTATVKPSGSYTKWTNVVVKDVKLDAGLQSLVLKFDKGGFNLGSMTWTGPTATQSAPFQLLDLRTNDSGQKLTLTFSQDINPATVSASGFTFNANFIEVGLGAAETVEGHANQIQISIKDLIDSDNILTMNYDASTLRSAGGEKLTGFQNLIVVNNALKRFQIEGKIKGSDFAVNKGLTLETCSDTDGGQDLGYTDSGDYLEFNVYVKVAGTYLVQYRYAAQSATGSIELALNDGGVKKSIKTTSLPPTGGWQTWNTVSDTVGLPLGIHTLRIQVASAGFNFNWANFLKTVTSVDDVSNLEQFSIYPNPCSSSLNYDLNAMGTAAVSVQLQDLAGRVLVSNALPVEVSSGHIDMGNFSNGVYLLKISSKGRSFTRKIIVNK